MTDRDSVFLRALGDAASRLRPEVHEYVAGPPAGSRSGVGRGVFEIAGSPYRRIAGLLRIVSGPDVALDAYERDVPFEIVNRLAADGSRPRLDAERSFRFRRGPRRFVDTLQVGRIPGTLVNTPGTDGRVELLLDCSVTADGNLMMQSRAARVRIGRRRIRLPKLVSVKVTVIDGWSPEHEHRTVDVSVRNPVLGTVLRYRGWFTYEYVPS